MKKKKDGSPIDYGLFISSAVLTAFIIVALFFGLLIWVFDSAYESSPPSSAEEKAFEEKYEAAQKKYEKYLNEPVSGQEVLDLIDNWDETDFEMTVSNISGESFRVSNWPKNSTRVDYWNKESIYYIDPNAFYEGRFLLFESPGRISHKGIGSLRFSLVEDPSLSDDNTTENGD